MATYFHGGPEIQADGLQTLYLMNPGYGGYAAAADAAAAVPVSAANMVYLNSASASSLDQPSPSSHGGHQQSHHFVGIPLQAPTVAAAQEQLSRQMSSIQMPNDIPTSVQGLIPRVPYNLWNQAAPAGNGPVSMVSQLGTPRPSLETQQSQKGLSLSLSPQHSNYTSYRPEQGHQRQQQQQEEGVPTMMPHNAAAAGQHGLRFAASSASSASNGTAGLQSFVMGSKYLKAAQLLLDEVVSVGTPRGVKEDTLSRATKAAEKADGEGKAESASTAEGSGKNVVPDLSTAERQELQMKKAKLINMLDEVEQRYRQYHQQMLIVISSFESIAGQGSARTYTSLALRTISKQFRCLRDAITGQIRAAGKSLGEEDCLTGSKSEGGSRLRLVDHHLRQQRALQQLGMMQHNAWRPQRGLPERSVSVLRAWLFEHFLHPYPKDSDKLMLAKQTGLTRNQVSNWFINARVRLWKPMVEEMYQEETKGHEHQQQQHNPEDSSNANKKDKVEQVSTPNSTSSPSRTEQSDSIISRTFSQQHNSDQQNPQFSIPPQSPTGNLRVPLPQYEEAEAGGLIQSNIKKARTNEAPELNPMAFSMMHPDLKAEEQTNQDMFMKFGDIMQAGDDQGFNLIAGHAAGFGGYSFGDIGRFDAAQFAPRFSGNSVSLTLGLQHCDQSLQQQGATQPSYLSNGSIAMGRRLDVSTDSNNGYCNLNDNNNSNDHTSVVTPNAYDTHSIQNRKRFAAQLLPDFVS